MKKRLQERTTQLLVPIKKPKGKEPAFSEKNYSRLVSKFCQPIESFFKWLNDKTQIQTANSVRPQTACYYIASENLHLHRTCSICGKSDWCSYTPDAKISFCVRITTNADRMSRPGWGVFYHEKSLFAQSTLPFSAKHLPKKIELAPIEIRDFVYLKLIALSPATRFFEIIYGPKGLRSRKILDFENYGSLPQSRAELQDIAKLIRVLLNREFPAFVRKQKLIVTGLPVFWLDKTGKIQLWSEKDYSCQMMVIPYCAASGLIQACQIRYYVAHSVFNDVR